MVTLAGRACGGKPVTALSELWIVGFIVAPGTVGAQNVLPFEPFGSPPRVIAVVRIEKDFNAAIVPRLSVLGSCVGGVGDDDVVPEIDRDIDSLVIMGHPGGETVITRVPCIIARGEIVKAVVRGDID